MEPHEEVCRTHFDDRGDVTELIHNYNLPQDEVLMEPEDARQYVVFDKGVMKVPVNFPHFGQTYVVRDNAASIIRAFHRHKKLWDFFSVVAGSAQIWVINPNGGKAKQYILSEKQISRLTIPPGHWHGWLSLEPKTIMICTGTEVYNREDPDEERMDCAGFVHLGVYWGSKPR